MAVIDLGADFQKFHKIWKKHDNNLVSGQLSPIQPGVSYLYPLKISENL